MPIRIDSDRLDYRRKKMREKMEYIRETGFSGPEYIPVDLVGARTDYPKDNKNPIKNMAKAARENRERFGLESMSNGEKSDMGY